MEKAQTLTQSFKFTHNVKHKDGHMLTLDGEICIFCEVVMISSFDNENLDVFNPIYTLTNDPDDSSVTHAHVTHATPSESTTHRVIKEKKFELILGEWLNSLDKSIQEPVRQIIEKHYDYAAWLS